MRGGIFSRIDLGLFAPAFVLVLLSLTTLFSLNISLFKNQLIFLVLSFAIYVFMTSANFSILKMYTFPIYCISIALLLVILVIGIETRGAVRWLEIFGVNIQFSEILKPFLAISLSSYLAKRSLSTKTFLSTIGFSLPILFLIYMQPDLGSVFIYSSVLMLALFIYGFSFWWFMGGSVAMFLLMPLVWNFLHDYQKQRILTYIHPTKDPLGKSYNVIQSVIAVGSGMLFGKGLSEGTQSGLRFLPERHTDFIFATLTEELGFLGGILVIAATAFLLYRIFLIFLQSDDHFCKLFAVVSFALFFMQAFVNIGMNMGIIPIVGVTLPFVSYGGSSLLSSFVVLGILSSISHKARSEHVLEIQ